MRPAGELPADDGEIARGELVERRGCELDIALKISSGRIAEPHHEVGAHTEGDGGQVKAAFACKLGKARKVRQAGIGRLLTRGLLNRETLDRHDHTTVQMNQARLRRDASNLRGSALARR